MQHEVLQIEQDAKEQKNEDPFKKERTDREKVTQMIRAVIQVLHEVSNEVSRVDNNGRPENFASQQYWEEWYSNQPDTFEWYINYR
jgi:hypothetical protein